MTPDKLFRDNLGSAGTPPPPGAWSRIAHNLQARKVVRKRNRILGLGLLALLCASAFLLLDKSGNKQPLPTTPTPVVEPTRPMAATSTKEAADGLTEKEHEDITRKPVSSMPTTRARNTAQPTLPTTVDQVATAAVIPDEAAVPVADVEAAPTIGTAITAVAGQPVTSPTSRKITYSASEVNARFKRKPKASPIDTFRKSPSTLQRVLDIAYEIKNENTWLGDFRQAKDELLSRPGNGPARDKAN